MTITSIGKPGWILGDEDRQAWVNSTCPYVGLITEKSGG